MPAIAIKKKSRRQGNKVWVEDPSVKGGGFWRKVGPAKGKIGVGAIAGAALAGGAIAVGSRKQSNPPQSGIQEKIKSGATNPKLKQKIVLGAKIAAGAGALTGAAIGTHTVANYVASQDLKKQIHELGKQVYNKEGVEKIDLAAHNISKNLPLPLRKGFDNLQGEAKSWALSELAKDVGFKSVSIDPKGRYSLFHNESNDVMSAVGKAGRHVIEMSATPATTVNQRPSYTVSFRVNASHTVTEKAELKATRTEALKTKDVLEAMYQDIADKTPNGSFLIAHAEDFDKKGARRSSLYKRFGFIEGGDGALYAYKNSEGKMVNALESVNDVPPDPSKKKREDSIMLKLLTTPRAISSNHAIARGRELLQARLDRNSQPSRRRGNEVWVADPTVKGGGFWRKVGKRKSGVVIALAASGAALLATQVARSKNTEKYSAPSIEQPQRPKPKLHKAVIIGGAAGLAGGIYAASQIPKTGNPMEDRGQSRSAQAALESSIQRQRESTKQLTGKLIIPPEEEIIPVETVTQTGTLVKQTKGKKESRKKTTEEIHELALELGRRAAQRRLRGRQQPSASLRKVNTEKLLKAMKTDPKRKTFKQPTLKRRGIQHS